MVKQIRDYVLEARQIREVKEQKNENLSVKEMIDEFDYGNIELRDLDNGQVEDLYYQMTKDPMTRAKIRTNLNDAKSVREEIKKYLLKHHGIKTESIQKNEAEFKPKLSENELKRNVDTSLRWLKVLLDDQKRKLKNDSWDEEDIKDTIDNVNSIIKGLEEIKRDLMS